LLLNEGITGAMKQNGMALGVKIPKNGHQFHLQNVKKMALFLKTMSFG
jgi:hypothetical protein